jgi:hypothetical protein
VVKPWNGKIGPDGFTRGPVTCLLSNTGFTREPERFHHRARQFHQRTRVLNFELSSLGSPTLELMKEHRRPALRTIEGGCSPSCEVIPLATFLPWKKRALRAERHAARLMCINKRLLLLPADVRARVNFSDFESALQLALDASEYDFGLFVARYTGG